MTTIRRMLRPQTWRRISDAALALVMLGAMAAVFPGLATAQWSPKRGDGGVFTSYRFFESTAFYDARGNKVLSGNGSVFRKHEIGTYTGGGLHGPLAWFGGTAVTYLQYKDDFQNRRNFGLSNLMLGLNYQLTDYPKTITAVLGSVTLPSYLPRKGQPEMGADFPEFEIGGAVGSGYSQWSTRGYWNALVQYRYRASEDKEHQIKAASTLGVDVGPRWLLIGNIDGFASFTLPTRSVKASFTAVRRLNRSWSAAAGTEYVLKGVNVGVGPGFSLGLWYAY